MMAGITTAPPDQALILDLAAGPVSCFGWRHRGAPLNLVPLDALAEDYAALIAEAGLTVPIPTRPGHAEALAELFAPGTVDLVHMRNGLDHCYDPARVIEGALQVLKPGGWLRVSGYLREGEKARYEGLHQWNLDLQDDRAIIWRPGQVIDPARQWPGAEVEAEAAKGWISLRMRRPA
jgi:SAM-dependent methyltransferase